MAYQVLARKWRPRSFATLVGQDHVVRALAHALDHQQLHHAYLFTGTRGVGKTTLARILAKALNCENGVSSTPCGECGACGEIDTGRFVDLLEVDAATNTRVEEMRQLLENAVYAPTRGRYKVYVIDEVHMLSNSAFNAVLKTLEEPPEHIKFILATTDPQKIPVTVLSRCLQFNLKQMSQSAISGHLGNVLAAEGVDFESAALWHLAKAASGSMRDALSLLDQAIAHGAGRVQERAVRDMLGTVGEDHLFELLDALIAGDAQRLVAVGEAMDTRSLSFDAALQEFSRLLHRIALLQMAPEAIADALERQRLQHYAQAMDAEYLQLAYQIAVQGRADLALAPDEHTGFCMTLLRLLAFGPLTPVGDLAGVAQPARTQVPARASRPTQGQSAAAPVVEAGPPVAAPLEQPAAVGAPQAPAEVPGLAGDDDWHELIGKLALGGMVRSLAQYCEWLGREDGVVRLRLPPARRSLLIVGSQEKLQGALTSHFGVPLRVQIELADTESQTPVERLREAQRERQDRAVEAIDQDDFVRDVIEQFDATVNQSSVRPI